MTSSQSDNSNASSITKRLASHPEASPQLLDKLTETDSQVVLERIAENSQTAPETLDKLSSHDEPTVRSAVVDNENTPASTLQSLSEDEHPDVRFRVAENPQVPAQILENLTEDENPYVAARAQETLKKISSVAQQADQNLLDEKFEEAEMLYRKLVVGLQELLGTEHCEVARMMHKLAATLAAQGKTEAATEVEEQVSHIETVHDHNCTKK